MEKPKNNSNEKSTYVMPAQCRLDPKLCPELIAWLDENVAFLSSVQRTTWHLINKNVFPDKKDLNKYLQSRFHIKTRTANSIISDMKGRHKSLQELKKRELGELDIRIARKKDAIDEIRKDLDAIKPAVTANQVTGTKLVQYRMKKKSLYREKIKLNRMENSRVKLKREIDSGVLSICFGTKALFRKQYELEKTNFKSREEWLKAFRANRDKNLYCLARGEETLGNQMRYLRPTGISEDLFTATVLNYEKDSKVAAEGLVRFTYCLPELQRQLRLHLEGSPLKKPVTARFVRKKKGWYLVLSLNVPKMPVRTKDRSGGVVSLDFNYSFIELTELNVHGNIINKRRLDIPHAGKGERGKHETRAAIKQAVLHAALAGKPLAVEDLDFTGKRARLLKKRAIGYNRMLSSLNYGKYREALSRRTAKYGVELITVSPAYTSQTAKKYMQAMHLNVHEAAAWQIGRRAMGFRLQKNKSEKQKAFEKKAGLDIAARKRLKTKRAKKAVWKTA